MLPFLAGVSVGQGPGPWWTFALNTLTLVISFYGARMLIHNTFYAGRLDAFEEVNKLNDRRSRWSQN